VGPQQGSDRTFMYADLGSLHARCRCERKLMRYLEDLIREMDRKIAKNKERAEKESAPRDLRPEDQLKLAEAKARAKGAMHAHVACVPM
jgi:hypothetical protein